MGETLAGKDHPSTLGTVNNMALVFDNQGEYEKALEWYQRALDGYAKTLGKDHHFTLTTVNKWPWCPITKGSMRRHSSGTSGPSMAMRRHSERAADQPPSSVTAYKGTLIAVGRWNGCWEGKKIAKPIIAVST